jgi:peptidoglycan/xylan/chitin deacetylase (PgdA/CDA1 family)
MVLTGFGVAVPALRSQAATRNPAQAEVRQPMYYIHDGPKRVALTIDDGPSPVYTPRILRLLDRYRTTAAFSMIGVNVQANPGVAREVAHAGHMIVNHTWTHPDLAYLSPATVYDKMAYGTEVIHRATGRTPHMFRAVPRETLWFAGPGGLGPWPLVGQLLEPVRPVRLAAA